MTDFEVTYTPLERMVHNLAMSQFDMQKSLSRMEDRGFERAYGTVDGSRPVFITGLPRSGTTLLLEVFAAAPEFATHTYRHMPFVLCPVTWARLSGSFRKQAAARERAHKDGMTVSPDSPEAFEEVLWKAFWPEHYPPDRILVWQARETDDSADFEAFFRQHMRKIIGLARSEGAAQADRYVSKNNTNIARIAWLREHVPDATVVVPYRDPASHVASLMRQHRRFTRLQAETPFVRRYMESIGHYEFGAAHRPIDFPGRGSGPAPEDLDHPSYWTRYWIEAYSAILGAVAENVALVSYDRICQRPLEGLAALERVCETEPGVLQSSASRFRPPDAPPELDIGTALRTRLKDVVARLDEKAAF